MLLRLLGAFCWLPYVPSSGLLSQSTGHGKELPCSSLLLGLLIEHTLYALPVEIVHRYKVRFSDTRVLHVASLDRALPVLVVEVDAVHSGFFTAVTNEVSIDKQLMVSVTTVSAVAEFRVAG